MYMQPVESVSAERGDECGMYVYDPVRILFYKVCRKHQHEAGQDYHLYPVFIKGLFKIRLK